MSGWKPTLSLIAPWGVLCLPVGRMCDRDWLVHGQLAFPLTQHIRQANCARSAYTGRRWWQTCHSGCLGLSSKQGSVDRASDMKYVIASDGPSNSNRISSGVTLVPVDTGAKIGIVNLNILSKDWRNLWYFAVFVLLLIWCSRAFYLICVLNTFLSAVCVLLCTREIINEMK